MFRLRSQAEARSYDLWVLDGGHDRRDVVAVVATLLGLDPRRAGKLVDSGAPIRHGLGAREVRYLHARFSDYGLGVRVAPAFPGRLDPPAAGPPDDRSDQSEPDFPVGLWLALAFAGLMAGGAASYVLFAAAMALGRFGEPALSMMPVVALLASGALGVLVGGRPARLGLGTGRLMGLVGLIAVLLALEVEGSAALCRWCDSGRSSDFNGPAAALAFVALCIAIAAPASAWIARPRERRS